MTLDLDRSDSAHSWPASKNTAHPAEKITEAVDLEKCERPTLLRAGTLNDEVEPVHSVRNYPFLRPPEQPDELGRLGGYRVLRYLGQGGMGYVFLAEDIALRRQVALKVMKPALEDGQSATERFLREARALAAIDHEHVVRVYQVGQEGTTVFMAMEYLRGRTLDCWIEKNGIPDADEALRLGREIAAGLDAIHRSGIIHRDLKPNNIWLEEPGRHVKLLDFGLARPMDETRGLTRSGIVVGTPGFMSPEQARGLRLDPRSDLFSLGCVLYYLCSGNYPFESATVVGTLTAIAVDDPQPIGEMNPLLSPATAALIMQLLEKQPASRPSSARQVIQRLAAIEHSIGGMPPAMPKQAHRPAERTSNPRRLALILSAVLLVGLMCVIAASRQGASGEQAKENDAEPGIAITVAPPRPSGILILDNCDARYEGKDEYRDNLTALDADGKSLFRVSGFNNCDTTGVSRTIAADPERDAIWVIENVARQIRRTNFRGGESLRIPAFDGPAIAVDPVTGYLWALANGADREPACLKVFDRRGQVVGIHDYFGRDIVYDPRTKAFWIVGAILTKLSASTGREVFSNRICEYSTTSIDVDPSGAVWVSVRDLLKADGKSKDRLMKFAADGEMLFTIDLAEKAPVRVSVDPIDGSVWVANLRKSAAHFSADGQALGEFPIPALTVQADPVGGFVWVFTETEAQRISADGEVTRRARYVGSSTHIWAARY